MRHILQIAVVGLMLTGPVWAQNLNREHGGDTYAAGEAVTQTLSATGDVFAAGSVITTSGSASGDIHAAGFDININTETGQDLYAAGSSVTITAPVGEDVTAAGYSVRSTPTAEIAGNLRFFGRNVTIEGPVSGAISAFGGTVHLNAPVEGDAWIVGESVTFGADARIDGTLILSAPDEISVPDSVIPTARITREPFDQHRIMQEWNESWGGAEMPMLPVWLSMFSAFLISAIFLLVLAAIFFTFADDRVEKMRRRVTRQPLQTVLLGLIGLSALFGMVPVTALTIVGIPFVPFAIFAILVVWTLGYLLAAYAIARRVFVAFDGTDDPTIMVKLVLVGLAICAVAVLNFIPFVGWVVNYTLVLFGVGAMTAGLLSIWIPDPDPALEADLITPSDDV